jgi:hypothetical protein
MLIKKKLEEKIAERDELITALERTNIAIELLEEMMEEEAVEDSPVTATTDPEVACELDFLNQNLPAPLRKIALNLKVKDKDRDALRRRIEDAGFFVATLPVWNNRTPELTVFENKEQAVASVAGHGPMVTPTGPLRNMRRGVFGMSTMAAQFGKRSVDSMVTFVKKMGFYVLKNGEGLWKLERSIPDCSHLVTIISHDPVNYTSMALLREASGKKYIPVSPTEIKICLGTIMKGGTVELNHNYNAVRFVPQPLKAVG